MFSRSYLSFQANLSFKLNIQTLCFQVNNYDLDKLSYFESRSFFRPSTFRPSSIRLSKFGPSSFRLSDRPLSDRALSDCPLSERPPGGLHGQYSSPSDVFSILSSLT